MSKLVPVRFTPDVIAVVKSLADRDRVTVSTWIRNLVGREIERRLPPKTEPSMTRFDLILQGGPLSANVTTGDAALV
jgi:hypothetical protein